MAAIAVTPQPCGVIENPHPDNLGSLSTIRLSDQNSPVRTDVDYINGPNVALPSDLNNGLGTIRESLLSCFKPVWGYFGPKKENAVNADDIHEIAFETISDLQIVGSGSQGVVFSGVYKSQKVAVKKVTELKEAEVKNLRNLKHENIIDFIGVCSKKPCYCIVMEFCEKGQLCEVLSKNDGIGKEKWLSYAQGIASGMNYLHMNNVIHRDLKSPNILVSDQDVIKICDFGTSRNHGKSNSTNMSFCGTVSWMAPEMLKNQRCSEKVDVYSFGVVLWEMVTRVAPFRNIAQPAIIYGVGTKKLSLPIPESIPFGLNHLMIQCLSLKPINRPSFMYIVKTLSQLALEFDQIPDIDWHTRYQEWKMFGQQIDYPEVDKQRNNRHDSNDCQCKERLRHIQDIRAHYEEKLKRTNKMFEKMSKYHDTLILKERDLKRWEMDLQTREAAVTKHLTTFYHSQHFSSQPMVGVEILSNMSQRHGREIYSSDEEEGYEQQRGTACRRSQGSASSGLSMSRQSSIRTARRYQTEPDLGFSPRAARNVEDSPGTWSDVRGTPNRSSGISQDSGLISMAPSVQNVSILGEAVTYKQKLYRNAEGRWSDGRIAQRKKPKSRESSFHRDSPARVPHVRPSKSQKSSPKVQLEGDLAIGFRGQRAKSMIARRSPTPYDNDVEEPMDDASPDEVPTSMPPSTSYSEALKSSSMYEVGRDEEEEEYLKAIVPHGVPINVMEASDELNSSMDSRTNGDASGESSSEEEKDKNGNGLDTSMDSRSSGDDYFRGNKWMSGSQSTMISSLELSLELGAARSDGLSDKESKMRIVKNSIRAHRRTPSNPTAMSAIQDESTSQSSDDCEDVEV